MTTLKGFDIMQTANKKQIVLNVDSEIADLFQNASERDIEKIGFMIGFLLSKPKKPSFLKENTMKWDEQALDAVSDEAEKKGLTPQILKDILSEG